MFKDKKTLWIVVIVVAVVASLTTVALLMLRAKAKKKSLAAAGEECTCLSFDCEDEDFAEEAVEQPVEE